MGMRKRILFVNPTSEISGAEVSLLLLLQGLDKTKYQPVLLLPNEGLLSERAIEMDVQVEYFPMHIFMINAHILDSLREGLRALPQVRNINNVLRSLDVDLVHLNSYQVGITFSWAAKQLGVPSIWHFRDIPRSSLKRKFISWCTKLPNRVIAISHAVANAIGGVNQENIVVVHNGVNLKLFDRVNRGKFREELEIDENVTLVSSIGQLVPWKGQDLLLRVFAKISHERPMHLAIVGGTVSVAWTDTDQIEQYSQYLRDLVIDLGLESKVTFTGFRDDIPQILVDSNIYVHTAMRPEPFGRVIIEAMAARRPVIAPNWGGIPEIVEQNRTGWLFIPRDESDLFDKLNNALHRRDQWEKMGLTGYELVREKFTDKYHVNKVQQVYAELL